MMQTLRSAIVTSALLLLSACAGTGHSTNNTNNTNNTTHAAAMNSVCPVSGEALESDCPTTKFDGKTVGFCCNNCMKKFDAMSGAEKQAKVTGAMPQK